MVYRSNIRLLVVLGVIPDALKTAGCAQSRAVNDFVHTSTFLVNFGSAASSRVAHVAYGTLEGSGKQ